VTIRKEPDAMTKLTRGNIEFSDIAAFAKVVPKEYQVNSKIQIASRTTG